jgi:glycosyltransferase involved in cell wall biosynthesis
MKLLIVSTSDSRKLSSWSNVPYLFCKHLEERGITLCRLTLNESLIISYIVRISQRVFGLYGGPHSLWRYSRSQLYAYHASRQITREANRNNVDAILVLNLTYGPRFPSRHPVYLFGDWTFDYAINIHGNKRPDEHEQRAVMREQQLIRSATNCFVLYPMAAKYLKESITDAKISYIGNVVNAVEKPCSRDIVLKQRSLSLLFIGKEHYAQGAYALLKAFKLLRAKYPELCLDIVGIETNFFRELPDRVNCHGYLDKGIDDQRQKYYRLIRKATIFVNTNPRWSGFSAMLEAMYFYTPVITSANLETLETFGNNLPFGYYSHEERGGALAGLLAMILESQNYEYMAKAAHAAASPYSWKSYVDKFLHTISKA